MIIRRFPRPSLPLLALILVLSLPILTACGLKGDLYLAEPGAEETPESLLPDDEDASP